jgi:putative SOS response-associated peptidase YedK
MCGRYRLSRRKQMIEEYFGSVLGENDWTPRYNIAPTQSVPVIRQNPKEPVQRILVDEMGTGFFVGESPFLKTVLP